MQQSFNTTDQESILRSDIWGGIHMCTTELLPCKNQKGLTRYLVTLFKRDSTADIFLEIFKFFLDKVFHKTTLNH